MLSRQGRWYHRNKNTQEQLDYKKNYYKNNKESIAKRSIAYYQSRKELIRERYNLLREEVFNHYGGYKCICCNELNPLFLTLDHINNDGALDRKDKPRGGKYYKWLKDNSYPTLLQVLCSNCNIGKMRNQGVCPHKVTK